MPILTNSHFVYCTENMVDQRRSTRTNRGQGGAIAQLEKVAQDIQQGGRKRKTGVVNMPEELSDNEMAPPPPKKRLQPSHAQVSPCAFSIVVFLKPIVSTDHQKDGHTLI